MTGQEEPPTQMDSTGTVVPVPKPEQLEERAYRGPDSVPIGTWGESETGWWGSAKGDVQTFDSEDAAVAWVRDQLGL